MVPARMVTATSERAATATVARGVRTALLRALPAATTVVGVAVLMRVVYAPWYLNYDARYALLWARDAWHGFKPEYGADFAPTPHPLETAVSSLALPFGNHGADQVIVWLILLAFGALVWFSYRLGAELFSPWVGVVTALVVLTRPAIERDAVLAYQDLAFEALVIGAVLLEARRPRRGLAVLAVLALAGLLRPEAWVLSALYVAYLWPRTTARERARLIAVAATAPVIWSISDLIVTGDALHSLNGTANLAEEAGRRRSVGQVPRWTAQYFAFTLREPLILGVPIGLVFAWLYARRRAVLPLAVAVAMTAVFAVSPVFGLPLIGRYLRTPSVLLALFYGLAVFGWRMLPPGRDRTRWLAIGMFALALSAAFVPKQVTMLRGLDRRTAQDSKFYTDLRAVGRSPVVRAAFARCAPFSTADHRPIPYLRWWLDGRPGSVGTIEKHASRMGRLLLVPRPTYYAKRFYKSAFPHVTPPMLYRVLYRNRSWRVYAAPGCGT
jgi:hypothetical protein